MSRRGGSRARRATIAIAALLVVLLVGVSIFAFVTVRRPLPQTDGNLTVPGLDAEVSVLRDAQGVPQIYADTPEDLFRAQGYVQAQDRFFEMDYRRHVTSGRLAELVGDSKEAIDADKVTRTFGWRLVAEEEWKIVAPETKAYLQAYADGVNAYLEDRDPSEIALEYTVLGTSVSVADPEPWDPIDSLAWLKAMAWDLRGNYDDELERAIAYGSFAGSGTGAEDPARVAQDVARVGTLFPAYLSDVNLPILDPAEVPTATAPAEVEVQDVEQTSYMPTLGGSELQSAVGAADRALAAVPVLVGRGEGTGSNSWAVSGEHTESGKPLLANDPHLALQAPGVWAQVGLHCNTVSPSCGFDVAGFSFAGFPGVIIGHNADVAWGLTNMGADVTDFFIERVRDETYLRGDDWVPLETRTETIKVNGGQDVELEVSSTLHGPIVSTVLPLDKVAEAPTEGTPLGDYEVALQWTALEPGRTADAVFAFGLAASPDDMREAAALFEVPAQNVVFATTDGHIGYQAPGRIPVRQVVEGPVPSDGTWPRPGWDERFDWTGYVPPGADARGRRPRGGLHRRGQPGRAAGRHHPVPHDGLGLRLPLAAHPGTPADRDRLGPQGRRRDDGHHPERRLEPVRRRPAPVAARPGHREQQGRPQRLRGRGAGPAGRLGRLDGQGLRRCGVLRGRLAQPARDHVLGRPARRRSAPQAAAAGSPWSRTCSWTRPTRSGTTGRP